MNQQKDSNITINQHIIPQFYQMFWDCGDRYVWQYEKNINFFKRASIGKNCSENYVYEYDQNNPDNEIENLFCDYIETPCSKRYRPLITGYYCFTNVPEKLQTAICYVVANLLTRNPNYIYENPLRHRFLDDVEKYHKHVNRREILNELALCDFLDLYNILKSIKATLYISQEPKIAFCDNMCINTLFFKNKAYFPLSPHLLLVFDNTQVNDRWNLESLPESIYNEFVYLIALHQQVDKIYTNNKQTILNIKEIFLQNSQKQHNGDPTYTINYITSLQVKNKINKQSTPYQMEIKKLLSEYAESHKIKTKGAQIVNDGEKKDSTIKKSN